MVECNERREIEIPGCKESNLDDCHRAYHIYLPSIICDDGDEALSDRSGQNHTGDVRSDVVGTLPLVFAIHCYGCPADHAGDIFKNFVTHANSQNVVLVLPEGLQNSFNARHCCGYALDNDIDDVGFLKHIQLMLSDEYSFLKSDVSYAVGWSNGGFMVMHAAVLFRSISPISGYTYDIAPALKKAGTFCVDGICVDAPSEGKSIFLHHGGDDNLVRPSGCCSSGYDEMCCCGIGSDIDTCVPVMEVAQNWASEINGCEAEEEEAGRKEEVVDKGQGEKEVENGQGGSEESSLLVPSYVSSNVKCLTATSTSCKANTTICIHEKSGHFNSPSFVEAFPFAEEVIQFFARDACGINDGKWNMTSGLCACPHSHGGIFCLDDNSITISDNEEVDDIYKVDSGAISSKRSHVVSLGLLLFGVLMFLFVVRRRYKGKTWGDQCVVDEEEATELVSQGLHTN